MLDRRKDVVNISEGRAKKVLRPVVERHGCDLHDKMGLADAVEINRSGLDDEAYEYALKAHLDLVVSKDNRVLFGVEVDGHHHATDAKTRRRDQLKDSVCERLGLPLLRIDDGAFQPLGDFGTVLEWSVEYYLRSEIGGIDPSKLEEEKAGKLRRPFCPALEHFIWFAMCYRTGRTSAFPTTLSWKDPGSGTSHGLFYVEVKPNAFRASRVVAVQAECRTFRLKSVTAEVVLRHIGMQCLAYAVKKFLAGDAGIAIEVRELARNLIASGTPGCEFSLS